MNILGFNNKAPLAVFPLDKSLFPFVPTPFPWCWKRDGEQNGQPYSRIVQFLPKFDCIDEDGGKVVLRKVDFYYSHTGPKEVIAELARPLYAKVAKLYKAGLLPSLVENDGDPDRATLIIESTLTAKAMHVMSDWLNEKPKAVIPAGDFPMPSQDYGVLDEFENIIVYAGSGVSYESGLPTLAQVHEYFHVDSMKRKAFTFGLDDDLPKILSGDPVKFFKEGFEFYIQAAQAEPSAFHRYVAHAFTSPSSAVCGIITDNLDKLFEKAGAQSVRVRTILSHDRGIDFSTLPGLQDAELAENTALLVAGIAADRRGIIKAARNKGMKIICVNPYDEVSPRAQNLSYLRPDDIWFKETASSFLANATRFQPRFAPQVAQGLAL